MLFEGWGSSFGSNRSFGTEPNRKKGHNNKDLEVKSINYNSNKNNNVSDLSIISIDKPDIENQMISNRV